MLKDILEEIGEEELESCYITLWDAIGDAPTARKIENQIKEAIKARDIRIKRAFNKKQKAKNKTKRELHYQECARKREQQFYKVPIEKPFDDGNGTEGEHISQL